MILYLNLADLSFALISYLLYRSDIGKSTITHLFLDNNVVGGDTGYFMHASTASAQEGDSAWLQTQEMRPNRECHVQCLQFYYYHSGNGSDQLNIWIREFQDEQDSSGTRRLMGQITGNLKLYDYFI